jgi:vancomycin resistance protein YoaR
MENKIVESLSLFKKQHKKAIIGILIFISTIFIIYLGFAIYFMNHFYFGSSINCISVSGKSINTVNEIMASELEKYELKLKERNGKIEQIKAKEIELRYDSGEEFNDSKEKQNPFKWIVGVFNEEDVEFTEEVKYDAKLLNEKINELACFDSKNIIEPKNPTFKYTDNGYVIVKEIDGNKVNKDILRKYLIDAILNKQTSIDLESIQCYVKPKYTSTSQKIIYTKYLLNRYTSSKITYTFGEDKEVLDGDMINKWLAVSEDIQISLDEKEIEKYMNNIEEEYNTVGKQRSFVTSSGNGVEISGGDYGWCIDKEKEIEAIIEAIKRGKVVTKDPEYIQTALVRDKNDIGNTYVEINLASQHLWLYKKGVLIADGPIVTGNVSNGHSTPQGIYTLKYKQKNAVLRGVDYAAPVSFWMPFNGGIGIHDAGWRSSFGGEIYKTSGSHGCINAPYYLAKEIFNNIQSGIPVVCY